MSRYHLRSSVLFLVSVKGSVPLFFENSGSSRHFLIPHKRNSYCLYFHVHFHVTRRRVTWWLLEKSQMGDTTDPVACSIREVFLGIQFLQCPKKFSKITTKFRSDSFKVSFNLLQHFFKFYLTPWASVVLPSLIFKKNPYLSDEYIAGHRTPRANQSDSKTNSGTEFLYPTYSRIVYGRRVTVRLHIYSALFHLE